MQQKLVWDSINLVLIGSKKATRDEKRPSLKQKNTLVAQAVTEERKFSTGGAKDYIPRQKERRIYFNWEDNYAQYHKEFQ
jgi:hypothetical protein